jgi:hypothetical protein
MAYSDAGGDTEQNRKELATLIGKKLEDARQLRTDRAPFLNETYRLTSPWRREVGRTYSTKAPVLTPDDVADIVDSTLADTQKDFSSDMISQFTPEGEPWTRFAPKGTIPAEFQKQVNDMAATTQERVFEALGESSYYDAAPQCFTDLGNGTMGMRARRPERGGDPFEFEPIEAADLLICHNAARQAVDARFTEGILTKKEYKSLYGTAAPLPDKLAHQGEDTELTVIDGFYRCWENPRGNRAWRRCITVNGDVTFEKYFNDDTDVDIFVARWEVEGRNPWGIGATWRGHPAQRALNEMTALTFVAAGKHIDPPFFYTDDGAVNLEQGLEAGDGIPVSTEFELHQFNMEGRFDVSFFTKQELQQTIRRNLYQERPEQVGKTPPTATQWQELDLRQRNRWEIPRGKIVREWVLPIVLWTRARLVEQGALGPYKIDQRVFKIEPNSPFAKARSQEKILRARDLMGTHAGLSQQTFPIDVDVSATMKNLQREMNDELVVYRTDEQRAQVAQMMAAAQLGAAPGGGSPNGQ